MTSQTSDCFDCLSADRAVVVREQVTAVAAVVVESELRFWPQIREDQQNWVENRDWDSRQVHGCCGRKKVPKTAVHI